MLKPEIEILYKEMLVEHFSSEININLILNIIKLEFFLYFIYEVEIHVLHTVLQIVIIIINLN